MLNHKIKVLFIETIKRVFIFIIFNILIFAFISHFKVIIWYKKINILEIKLTIYYIIKKLIYQSPFGGSQCTRRPYELIYLGSTATFNGFKGIVRY